MIKAPVKDRVTVPWMSAREIPAVKMLLSAWREMRKDWKVYGFTGEMYNATRAVAEAKAREAAYNLEVVAMIEEALRKEARK